MVFILNAYYCLLKEKGAFRAKGFEKGGKGNLSTFTKEKRETKGRFRAMF